MILYPAIDLKDGKCVRLYQGDMDKTTIFNTDPVAQALKFQHAGCKWLHIVDLDGAFKGEPVNTDIIKEIIAKTNMKIQLGGGIRSHDTIDFWLKLGIERVILGTSIIKDSIFVADAIHYFGDKVAISIDALNGYVSTSGWKKHTNHTAVDVARDYAEIGVSTIIYTDISRDGTMSGHNIPELKRLLDSVNVPIIASGGIRSIEDLQELEKCHQNLNGAIVGKAIYENKININKAIMVLGK